VNALAYETCFEMEDGRNRTNPITAEMVIEAKERLISRRETHLDQLIHKLEDERVQRVISPMLEGGTLGEEVRQDDIQYVLDLGLIRRIRPDGIVIANPIYREIIPRELSYITQLNLESRERTAWYVDENGRLHTHKLLAAFQQFFREHSEHWVERFDYKEAGPQLLMQAFLQRIVNGGGRVEREYGLGRQRTDLALFWPVDGGMQRTVIELKLLRKSREATIRQGLEQTAAYMDKIGTADGHLVIFDRRPEISWDEKIFREEREYAGKQIIIWGMKTGKNIMHKKNALLWLIITGLLVSCPSFFCWGMGLGIFLSDAGYGSAPEAEQIPFAWGVVMLVFGLLFWLLPLGVWRYARRRPAPTPKPQSAQSPENSDGDPYSPFSSDPWYDANASVQNMDNDF
jgi:hypothetical protein